MTESLREALRRAAAEGTVPTGVSGRDLLQRGRRKARRRTISSSAVGALALVAAIGIPLGPNLLSGTDDRPTPAPAPDTAAATHSARPSQPTEGPLSRFHRAGDLRHLCGEGIDPIANWTVQATALTNGHMTIIMTSPDGTMFADCMGRAGSAGIGIPQAPNVEDDPGYTYLRHRLWTDNSCARTADPCIWGTSGQISTDVARMVFKSSDGQTSEADVNNGFFAWQVEADDNEVFNKPLWVELYDANGNLIDRVNANLHPEDW